MYWIAAAFLLLIVALDLYLRVSDQHVHFHAQNLTDGKLPLWRQGRCWWYLSPNDQNKRVRYPPPTINPTWYFGRRDNGLTLGFDIAGDEFDFAFHFGLPWLCSLHLELRGLPFLDQLFRDARMGYGYDTSLKFFDNAVWIHVAHNDTWGARFIHWKWLPSWIGITKAMGYGKYPGVGFYVSWHYLDMLLGKWEHETVQLWPAPITAEIPIEPDNTLALHYFGTFTAQRHTWWRKRFPWIRHIHHYVDIDVKHPPLHSGKGENSYDLDDDGIFGMGVPGTTLEEAIKGYQDAVYNDRRRYGMSNAIYLALRGNQEEQIKKNIREVLRGDGS